MTSLDPSEFPQYFEALHSTEAYRVEPFPWQTRLLKDVAESGWPDVLDLPTGTGKTAVIDVALFHLALEAKRSSKVRRAPRRIVMVVDRRTVVDQAHLRAKAIERKLREASEGILLKVASALRSLVAPLDGVDVDPLLTAILRGGMVRDPSWARRPDQPLVVVSTVDQVGSRLLFRGYGVSPSMRPVHAGLLGNDTLILLDEVHLSRPFDQTLEALEKYRGWAQAAVVAPWRVVRLSATPGVYGRKRRLSLSDDDRRNPVLARRLAAHKPARLRMIVTRGEEEERRQAFAHECAKEALSTADSGRRTVAVVVNRVDTARRIYEILATGPEDGSGGSEDRGAGWDTALLTGRMRPFDRDALVERLKPRISSGRIRRDTDRPLIVVATQCIEAGADLDFDGLVTECASLDALRQRFGRLDRLGDFGRARAVILTRRDQIEGKDADPVYGEALRRTWEWLSTRPEWDFGVDHLDLPMEESLRAMLSAPGGEVDDRRDQAPILLPAHLDAWVQTAPGPAVEPDVSLWLHGFAGNPADVQIVWRADVEEAQLEDPELHEELKDWLAVAPPVSAEALSVPFYAVLAWLRKAAPRDVADVEGGSAPDERPAAPLSARKVVLWRGDDTTVVDGNNVRPGDTIVVPVGYGGLGIHWNWDPQARVGFRVGMDIGDLVQRKQRGRAVLRLHPATLRNVGLPEPPSIPEDASPSEMRAALAAWLDAAQPEGPSDVSASLSDLLGALRSEAGRIPWRTVTIGVGSSPRRVALIERRPHRDSREGGESDDLSTEPDVSAFTAAQVSLEEHSRGVERWARHLASQCGLPDRLVEAVALAGWLHDTGKADGRFQALLRGGSQIEAAMGEALLAKSGIPAQDRVSRERARKLSGYPKGMRHEMLSVALAEGIPDLGHGTHDQDLVLHLIASHHGYARPFAPPVGDPQAIDVALVHGGLPLRASTRHTLARADSPVVERFWRLVRRYGWFGLAWIEAILRLSDHRCSEQEAEAGA